MPFSQKLNQYHWIISFKLHNMNTRKMNMQIKLFLGQDISTDLHSIKESTINHNRYNVRIGGEFVRITSNHSVIISRFNKITVSPKFRQTHHQYKNPHFLIPLKPFKNKILIRSSQQAIKKRGKKCFSSL
jgi:hypothetical protein